MPFDLDAVASEAAREPFTFTFGGDTYTLPPDVDLRIIGSLTSGDITDALRRMLGEEQWKKLEASPAVLTSDRFSALLNAYLAHSGLNVGEASASTGS